MQHQMARVIYKSKKGCMRDFKSLSWKLSLDLNNDNKMNILKLLQTCELLSYSNKWHMISIWAPEFSCWEPIWLLGHLPKLPTLRMVLIHVTLLWRDNDWSRVPSALIITITDQHKNWTQMDENTWIWINFYMYLWKKLSFIPSPKKSL